MTKKQWYTDEKLTAQDFDAIRHSIRIYCVISFLAGIVLTCLIMKIS